MTREEIEEYVTPDVTPERDERRAFESFVAEMADRQYSEMETNDAWLWFAAGWEAHVEASS